ncbi:dTDP-4-dehydrorhamnose reductase [Hyunsoonleella jejuensis]|uniref:dTDP-4-dehydrorhamnose reductase n=1 Tax=Hyunsoonleella jejuensis TaxID=419940 RepID=A0A1H9B0U7_9FLAO|nr:dTDP-4-dehydrorhamnose reductase [Hyunsoonleella jejuensis]
MKKNVLVTGADGQLGQTIKELYAVNKLGLDFVFVSKKELDITNIKNIDNFFDKHKFEYCINCAAYTNVEEAEKTPELAYNINAEGVKNLAYKCKETNTVLIHVSTDYVFDGEKKGAYTINDKPNPINEYGKSKLEGENYIHNILNKYFIIRTSWLYSRKYGNNFYKTIVKKATTKKELCITTEQKGCPTSTINLSKFIIKLIQENYKAYGILHFCDEKIMTWFDFAKQVLLENNMSNSISLVKVNNYRTFARRPKNSVLKSSKSENLFKNKK